MTKKEMIKDLIAIFACPVSLMVLAYNVALMSEGNGGFHTILICLICSFTVYYPANRKIVNTLLKKW